MAKGVNLVWNYLNELSSRAIREKGVFLSAYDLQRYTNGSSKALGLAGHTIQCVGQSYVQSRIKAKKAKLGW